MGVILLVILVLLVMGGLPTWGYHDYGYGPSSVGSIVVMIVLILLLTGRL